MSFDDARACEGERMRYSGVAMSRTFHEARDTVKSVLIEKMAREHGDWILKHAYGDREREVEALAEKTARQLVNTYRDNPEWATAMALAQCIGRDDPRLSLAPPTGHSPPLPLRPNVWLFDSRDAGWPSFKWVAASFSDECAALLNKEHARGFAASSCRPMVLARPDPSGSGESVWVLEFAEALLISTTPGGCHSLRTRLMSDKGVQTPECQPRRLVSPP